MKADLKSQSNIETPFLRIQGNCLEFKNTSIQLSNISLFSTTDITPARFPVFSVVLILAGLACLRALPVPALLAVLAGGVWIYLWYQAVKQAKQSKRLTIVTNSGNAFPIVFNNQEFLTRVVNVLTDIIRNPSNARDVIINIKDCTFMDDASAIGTLID